MKNIFDLLPISRRQREKIIFSLMPNLLMELFDKYLRLHVSGAENIPKKGPVLIIPNHSGYSGLDAMILSHEIVKLKNRIPKVLTHHLWFASELTAKPAQKLGFIEATSKNGLHELQNDHIVIVFPEGERGNFKPTKYAYKLQEFKRGFIRMALETHATIIPAIIVGAEETHINLKKIKFGKNKFGVSLPVPLNVFPLPVKWNIKFLPRIHLPYDKGAVSDSALVHKLSEQIQIKMQQALNEELQQRKGVFINRPNWLKDTLKNFGIKF